MLRLKRLPLAKCKYLGIYLDDQLNWKHHIDYICEKLVKFTGIFYRLTSKISCGWLRNIYYSFVYPHLLYGIEMYANTCVTYLDKVIKFNNKILRILQKCPISTQVLELYTKFNVLPLDKLHNHTCS